MLEKAFFRIYTARHDTKKNVGQGIDVPQGPSTSATFLLPHWLSVAPLRPSPTEYVKVPPAMVPDR